MKKERNQYADKAKRIWSIENTKKTHKAEFLDTWRQLKPLVHTVNVIRLQNPLFEARPQEARLPSLVFSYQALGTLWAPLGARTMHVSPADLQVPSEVSKLD
jgi:hypothetical protein